MTNNHDEFLQTDELPSRSARTKDKKTNPFRQLFKRKQKIDTGAKVPQKVVETRQSVARGETVTPDLSELPARVKKVIEAPAHEQVAAGIEDARIEDARVELPETPLEPKPNELVFYQTLQAVQEQATALAVAHPAVPVTVNTRKGLPRWVWMVLAGSLVINLGAGYLVYKYRKDNATPAAKPAATPAVTPAAQAAAVAALTPQQQEALKQLAAQQAADTVPIVRQEVAWSLEQKEALSKGERTRIESVLSTVKKPDDFKNGSFNFVFVTGVNQVQAVHGGGAIVSAFVSNGYLKGYSPKLIKLNVYYGAQLILSGAYNEKLSQWAPNDVYMIQFAFTPNDIRDAAVLDKVSKSPTEQTKLRFEARIAFDQASNKPGAEKEEKWELMNTHTDVPVIKK